MNYKKATVIYYLTGAGIGSLGGAFLISDMMIAYFIIYCPTLVLVHALLMKMIVINKEDKQ